MSVEANGAARKALWHNKQVFFGAASGVANRVGAPRLGQTPEKGNPIDPYKRSALQAAHSS